MSRVNITVHFDNEKESGTIGVRTLASVSSRPIAINFNYDVTVWLTEAQLRDLRSKIDTELDNREAEAIKQFVNKSGLQGVADIVAAVRHDMPEHNPQLIANLKAGWIDRGENPPATMTQSESSRASAFQQQQPQSPEAETAQQHLPQSNSPDIDNIQFSAGEEIDNRKGLYKDHARQVKTCEKWMTQDHDSANAEQVEMLEKEAL